MNDDYRLLLVLRKMAWQRARGELKSMLETYTADEELTYETAKQAIKEFIKQLEDVTW
jgi:hypothetical protein